MIRSLRNHLLHLFFCPRTVAKNFSPIHSLMQKSESLCRFQHIPLPSYLTLSSRNPFFQHVLCSILGYAKEFSRLRKDGCVHLHSVSGFQITEQNIHQRCAPNRNSCRSEQHQPLLCIAKISTPCLAGAYYFYVILFQNF